MRWRPLSAETCIEGAAAYQIRMVCRGRAVQIPRFLDSDARGILAIGESGCFENRRGQFCHALENGNGHSEGNLLWWLSSKTHLRRKFAEPDFQYRVCAVPSKRDAQSLESREMRKYVSRFGEVPPLNSAIPGRVSWIAELRAALRDIA